MVTCFSSVHTKALVFSLHLAEANLVRKILHLTASTCTILLHNLLHFAPNDSGAIVQNGTVEVLEDVSGEGNDPADEPIPVKLGHRRCAKIGSKKCGVEWELHLYCCQFVLLKMSSVLHKSRNKIGNTRKFSRRFFGFFWIFVHGELLRVTKPYFSSVHKLMPCICEPTANLRSK